MNTTFISDWQNKKVIGARAPSVYIGEFFEKNKKLEQTLKPHFIDLGGFGIEDDDYSAFLTKRAERIYKEISTIMEPNIIK